jgi:hypothetical protein
MSASVFLYLSSHWYLDLWLHNANVQQHNFEKKRCPEKNKDNFIGLYFRICGHNQGTNKWTWVTTNFWTSFQSNILKLWLSIYSKTYILETWKAYVWFFFLAKHFHSTNFMDSTNLLQYKILVKSRSSYDYDVIQVQVFVTERGTIFNCSRSYQPSIH